MLLSKEEKLSKNFRTERDWNISCLYCHQPLFFSPHLIPAVLCHSLNLYGALMVSKEEREKERAELWLSILAQKSTLMKLLHIFFFAAES